MQTAGQVLASPLPLLRQARGTSHPSVSTEWLHQRFIHQWTTFDQEIRSALASLDLNFQIAHIDSPSGEVYLVGNEIGLSAGNGDGRYSSLEAPTSDVIPDVSIGVTLSNDSQAQVKIVGELKTYWTVALDRFSPSDPVILPQILPHLGQLVAQMRKFGLRYGFLSTYRGTVFVKRTADFAFCVSPPIRDRDTNLSGHDYIEGSDFRAERLRGQDDLQASLRPSGLRDHAIEGSLVTGLNGNVTPNTIILGHQGRAISILNVSRRISPPSHTDKALFEIEHQGTRHIVKCWSPRQDRASNAECAVYERLSDSRPSGYDVFANMILAGNIMCSSLFPNGRALVLPYKDGQILAHVWDELSNRERTHVREECEKAIRILRSLSIYVPDAGKHNVLYQRETGAVTMLDSETAMECLQSEHVPYVELLSLFGNPTMMHGHTTSG
ncbi:hypothetical protein DTO006G1_3690 [Penicillium roqueforti]|nr:hypothetical protein CBS147337_154 [Penicillium roqueforti]KAI2707076.1 hypothetical protein CBS147372_987 [Penicillium roqueforti]KAI2723714.1 hypothetical protein CBS147318_645 [Penicillium roqueforti]KAI2761445.1 hypothetical protein DTO006G1_3690 [Penicillium roqueforti]KAI3134107.1 hypothetical protein CBS147330_3671 [Penicillium roqueforti]